MSATATQILPRRTVEPGAALQHSLSRRRKDVSKTPQLKQLQYIYSKNPRISETFCQNGGSRPRKKKKGRSRQSGAALQSAPLHSGHDLTDVHLASAMENKVVNFHTTDSTGIGTGTAKIYQKVPN